MKAFIKFSCAFIFLVLLFACSGSKKSADQIPVQIENEQLRAQVEDLQDKIADNPDNPGYRRELASIYYENGSNLEAMKTLEQAFVVDPNDAESKYLYAEIALNSGDKYKAYQSYKEVLQSPDGENYLDRIAPEFTDAFQLTKIVGTSANEAFGSFSSEGNRIIYQSDQNGNWDIFEYDLVNGQSKQLTNFPAQEENPQYFPNSTKILYTSTVDDHRDVEYDQKLRDIFVADLASGKVQNLTTNGSNDWRPRFSADGRFITFVSERGDLREVPYYQLYGNIYLMENDGRFQMELTNVEANNGNPCIVPGSTEQDGTIYFDSNRDGNFAIFKMNFKGEETRKISFNQNANDVSPDISPNGDKIVFFSDRDGNYEIYMMNTDGSSQQRLTANPMDDLNPVFSPDGVKILFHSSRSGNYDLYLLDLSRQSDNLPLYEVVNRIDQVLATLE